MRVLLDLELYRLDGTGSDAPHQPVFQSLRCLTSHPDEGVNRFSATPAVYFVMIRSKPLPSETARGHAINAVAGNIFRMGLDTCLVMVNPDNVLCGGIAEPITSTSHVLIVDHVQTFKRETERPVQWKVQDIELFRFDRQRCVAKVPADQFGIWKEFLGDLTAEQPIKISSVVNDCGFHKSPSALCL